MGKRQPNFLDAFDSFSSLKMKGSFCALLDCLDNYSRIPIQSDAITYSTIQSGKSRHPMRFGLMLRAFDEKGGIGVYTRNVVRELLRIDRKNEYVLFFRNTDHIGGFSDYPNVEEVFLKGANKAIWDQIKIPRACKQKGVDVIFHPKFTVPLFTSCKTVMTVHGADWFVPGQAEYYSQLDVFYIRAVMPRYIRKCETVISVSELTTDNFNRLLNLPNGKMKTVYFAPARHFKPISEPKRLEAVREMYGLPNRYILTLSKRDGDARKNVEQIFKSYAQYHRNVDKPFKLVVAGKDCHQFRDRYQLPSEGYGRDILFPGYIEQQDLPAVYSQASLFFYPSNLEAFPIPITEAMSCGTPIVTSNVNGLMELAGDAAVLVDPGDTQQIARAIYQVLSNPSMRDRLSSKGLERANIFSWDKCARRTLEILESAGR